MDPNDLLFLHSTLAATIRTQQTQIEQLQAEVHRLSAAAQAAPTEAGTQ